MNTASSLERVYRRKKNRLEWHYNPDCRKFPKEDFQTNQSETQVMSSMICPICKRLEAQDEGIVDTRTPKSLFRRFF